jgi:hypothetical protein
VAIVGSTIAASLYFGERRGLSTIPSGGKPGLSLLLSRFSDLCSGLMPVILSTAVGVPFIEPDHVRAVSNFFVVFVVGRFRHLHSLSKLGSNWRSPNA